MDVGVDEEDGEKMADLTYSVRGRRMELLFWKKEPAAKVKR